MFHPDNNLKNTSAVQLCRTGALLSFPICPLNEKRPTFFGPSLQATFTIPPPPCGYHRNTQVSVKEYLVRCPVRRPFLKLLTYKNTHPHVEATSSIYDIWQKKKISTINEVFRDALIHPLVHLYLCTASLFSIAPLCCFFFFQIFFLSLCFPMRKTLHQDTFFSLISVVLSSRLHHLRFDLFNHL